MPKKPILVATATNLKGAQQHFFAASVGSWRVSIDLAALIVSMRKEGLPFNVWLVPGAADTPYLISNYAPQAPGSIWLCAYRQQDV